MHLRRLAAGPFSGMSRGLGGRTRKSELLSRCRFNKFLLPPTYHLSVMTSTSSGWAQLRQQARSLETQVPTTYLWDKIPYNKIHKTNRTARGLDRAALPYLRTVQLSHQTPTVAHRGRAKARIAVERSPRTSTSTPGIPQVKPDKKHKVR